MEVRIASLERHVHHIQADVTEVKAGMQRLDQKIDGVEQHLSAKIDAVDQRLSAKIDGVDQRLSVKIDAVDQRLSAKIDAVDQRLSAKIDTLKDCVAEFRLATEKSFSRLSLWALMLYIALAVTLLGVMAKGFGWIK